MSAINYDRWSNLDSDDSDNEAEEPSRPQGVDSSNSSSVLVLAKSRKSEADSVLDAVNNRRVIDSEAASVFARARRLYEGSLAAVAAAEKAGEGTALELFELKKSCHLNIVAGALQERTWAVALDHCEKALALDSSNVRALEVMQLVRPLQTVGLLSILAGCHWIRENYSKHYSFFSQPLN